MMLPYEIWCLVLDEAPRDFHTFFSLAQTSRGLASLALPVLYSLYETAFTGPSPEAQLVGDRKLAVLWRSILLSCEGKTAFPYCLWTPCLNFRDLENLLSSTADYPDLQSFFFGGDMAPYFIEKDLPDAGLDKTAVVRKAGETITQFLKEVTERDRRAAGAVYLGTDSIPPDLLPAWVSRLAALELLHVHGCACLDAELAAAIRDNCPRFRQLGISSSDCLRLSDAAMASFLCTLRPNSLEVLSICCNNNLSGATLAALTAHATSLKRLELMVTNAMLAHLGTLRPCVSLERLGLYGDRYDLADGEADDCDGDAPFAWAGDLGPCMGRAEFFYRRTPRVLLPWMSWDEVSFADTAAWLSACTSLASFSLVDIPSISALLCIVLQSPALRLRFLHVMTKDHVVNMDDASFLDNLCDQPMLEALAIGSDYDEYRDPSGLTHTLLFDRLCKCTRLQALKLTDVVLMTDHVAQLAAFLQQLEVLVLDTSPMLAKWFEMLDDSAFEPMLTMPALKNVCIKAGTRFTAKGIEKYIDALGASGRPRGGMRLEIAGQLRDAFIPGEERQFLVKHARTTLGMELELRHCDRDPING